MAFFKVFRKNILRREAQQNTTECLAKDQSKKRHNFSMK